MYESQTYEVILQRMLDRVPNNIDKREGSIIYDALAPSAAELAQMYIEIDNILNESFSDTASRESLIRIAADKGIAPKKATNAALKGVFNIDIPMGSRFSCGGLNYIAIEKMNKGIYKMQCEQAGEIGNQYFGQLIPIEYIEGLETAELTEILIPGENEESTESLRKRYHSSLQTEAFGGNIADYKEKVNKLAGVGGVKVYPGWNGGGSVKIVFINSECRGPSDELVLDIQSKIDPKESHGEGFGIAPIGHTVTVVGVLEQPINISASIAYQDGWGWEAVKTYAQEAIDSYFKELSIAWADSDSIIVRISQIETRLLNLPGILDIAGTAINGEQQNFMLGNDEIPVRGNLLG